MDHFNQTDFQQDLVASNRQKSTRSLLTEATVGTDS